MKSLVICPTRGRPNAAREAYQSFNATKASADTTMIFVVDDDDPDRDRYEEEGVPVLLIPSPGNMCGALNHAAKWALDKTAAEYLCFVGDDHHFRTPGWDKTFTSLLEGRGGGMVYGDDLFRKDGDIPTHIFMSASIIRALGWMGLPGARHLYLDNTWRVLGDEAGCLYYMPDIVVEHVHPAAGKAVWDANYQRVNAAEVYNHDAKAYLAWLENDMVADVAKVRLALGR